MSLRHASIRRGTMIATREREKRLLGAKLVAIMERDYIHGNSDNIVKRKRVIQGYMAFPHQMVGY